MALTLTEETAAAMAPGVFAMLINDKLEAGKRHEAHEIARHVYREHGIFIPLPEPTEPEDTVALTRTFTNYRLLVAAGSKYVAPRLLAHHNAERERLGLPLFPSN
jgi:hypothetical protein